MQMPFGRYEGKTLEQIAEQDLDYLRWLLREQVGPDELRAEAARLLEERTLPIRQPLPRLRQLPPWMWGLAGAVLGALVMLVASRSLAPASPQPVSQMAPVVVQQEAVSLPPTPAVGLASPVFQLPAAADALARGIRVPVPDELWERASASTPTTALLPRLATLPAEPTPHTQVALTPVGDLCQARQEGTLGPEEAVNHVGEYRSIQFRVVRTYNSGKAVFLNSHDPWQGYFEVVIFPEHWGEFPQPPEDLFLNRCVVIYGKLQLYKGTPEIVLQSADHIRIVE